MRRAILVAALAAIVGLTIAAAGGSATKDDNVSNVQRFARIDPSLLTVNGSPLSFVPQSISSKPVSVMLELSAAPVAVQDVNAKEQGQKLSTAQKDSIRKQLKGQQDSITGAIQSAGGTVVSQMQDAYNGVQVVVPQKNVPQLAALPGVAAVHAVQLYQRDNTHTDPYVGAPSTWGNFHYTGQGVNVAIIDTGVDYTHADFGGPGTVAAYQAAAAHDTTAADPTMFGPSAPKIKGGFDLVGDAYNPVAGNNTPVPDPNPLDCAANLGGGHGTHTAGTLGGFGVLSNGHTYTGTYDANTISGNSWTVGPGVAPQANIYEYRVFGCTGATNVLAEAINMAVAQGNINVISMSIGSPLGGIDDPSAVAAQNAVNDGIAVVASAGNNGGSAYIVGSPSTASGVLSVAALDATPTFPAATFSPQGVTAIDANGAAIPTGPLKILVLKNNDATHSIADGCFLSEYPTGVDLSSTVVVVRRGGPAIGTTGPCSRVHKAYVGQAAGAAAVVMANNTAGLPPFEGKITSDPNDPTQTQPVHIPFLGVTGSANNPPTSAADGAAFTLYNADGQATTLAATTVANPGFTLSASFTSGGPRNPDSAPKPDVIAPGVSVASAGVGTGTEAAIMSGTSMACPATAGVAALVKQAHPTWNGLQIKAAIMNTADPSKNGGYNSRTAGAGEVQAQNAVNSATLATTEDGLHALAFGFIAGTSDVTLTRSFKLTNNAAAPVTYNLTVAKNSSRGEVITVPSSVTVGAGASQTVPVTLSYTAAAIAALPTDDTFGGVGPGAVATSRGDIVATPASGSASNQQRLEIPYMAVPRGLSNVVAGALGSFSKVKADTWNGTLPLSNSGIHQGTADLYTWGIHDPQESGREWDVRDAGVQILPGAALGGTDADRGLVFLVNTYGAATNQTVDEYDVVIDTNGDGAADYVVAGADDGAVFTGSFNGIMDSFIINVATGAIVDAFRADAPMNGTTIELPALASDLGLSSAKVNGGAKATSAMTYAVNSFSELTSGTDTTSAASIDVFDPSVSSGDFATLAPNGGTASMTLTLSKHIKQNPALGWLVASVDDASGAAQADEVAAPTVN